MTRRLGNGLPSTVTPERIQGILKFAKRQEKEFREALDRGGASAWRQINPSGNLYSCLHDLLRTADGRIAYERAREDFEKAKRKRLGRADILGLLMKDISRTIFGANESVPIKDWLDIPDEIVQKNAWNHFAELLWLFCALRERDEEVSAGDILDESLKRYPNLGLYLEEVGKNIVIIEDPPKGKLPDGERAALARINDIRNIVTELDAERLDKKVLEELRLLVLKLIEIAETAEKERRDVEYLRALISDWRRRYADEIKKSGKIDEYISRLDSLVETGDTDRDFLDRILSLFSDAFEAEDLYEKTRSEVAHALKKEDYEAFRRLTDAPEYRKNKRDAVYTDIDKELSRASRVEEPRSTTWETAISSEPEKNEEVPEDDNIVKPILALEHEAKKDTPDPQRDTEETASARPTGETRGAPAPQPDTGETKPGDIGDASVERIEAGIATAIEHHRFALAYYLACAEPKALPSANAVKLVACNYATDDPATVTAKLPNLADALLQEAETVLGEESERKPPRDYAALLASAALVPALQAPGGPVGQLLLDLEARLGDDMPSLRTLVRATGDFSMYGLYLPAGVLRGGDPLEKWEEEEKVVQKDVESWIENNRRAKIKYQRATAVWIRILDIWKKGDRTSIGWIFEKLKNPADTAGVNLVPQIDYWRDNGNQEIDRIDREKYNGPKKIEGPARMDLREKINEAVNLADRWCKLIRARPTEKSEFQEKKSLTLRSIVRNESKAAIEEIDQLAAPTARAARKLISNYVSMFEESASGELGLPMRLPDLLNGWLLLDPDIRFDRSDNSPDTPIDISRLMELVELSEPNFGHAAIARAQGGDFRGAGKAIDFARKSGLLGREDEERTYKVVEEEREYALQKIKEGISKLNERLDNSYAKGIVPLETFEQLRDHIRSIDFLGTDEISIDEIKFSDETIGLVNEEIDNAENKTGERLRQSLAKLNDASPEDKKRIQDAVEEQRFSVVEDYIERIRRGENLPETETRTPRLFDEFFPKFVDAYTSFQDSCSDPFERAHRAIKNRGQAGPIDAALLSEDTVRDGGRLLERWSDLRAGKVTHGILKVLFDTIGFTGAEIHPVSGGGKGRAWTLKSKPVSDRGVCRLADFGSRAQGHYRLIVIRGYAAGEKIVQEVGEELSDGGPPNIVLFLNVLDTDARRMLAHNLGSERCRPTLVLDEVLAMFLATRPSGRLAAFFDCASAFTFAQPFDPDAIEVPPEMFFGRDSERRAILAMSGSTEITHLVYGGRRLGKTALLANIAHTCRTEKSNWVVSLINLKGTGIGGIRPADELWKEIATPLIDRKIVGSGTIRPESIEKGVCNWLDGDPDQRILLLVDEADEFLEADGDGRYRVLEEIKRLMDRTERRFKVVFAGLHNVQRTARDPNTPFAHLGEPIRVGPMLPETDPEKIENLIRHPLEALGYRFTSVDSVIRIAAESNYYPALAQQFCKELLRELRGNGHMHNGTGPPYTISPEIVDRVLDSKETRERVRNLFQWTIQLDLRYEFLAYLVAQRSFDNENVGLRSVPIDDIRQIALKEWPAGFESDSTFLTFQVLLEEMVGLGILRKVGDKEDYTIRTRNLRTLLGNDEEIERRLTDAKHKLPPPKFDSASFRNTLDDGAPSPLTASQENQILSGRKVVGLVFGTALGDLDRMYDALVKAGENKSVDIRTHKAISADMDDKLREISRDRGTGIDIVLIDARENWKSELVERTVAFVARLDSRERTIRPVFLLGPDEAWARMMGTMWWDGKKLSTDGFDVGVQEIWLAPCAKDFTRRWLTDREAPACAELENRDPPIDPLWPVVAQAAARDKPDSIADAIRLALSGGDLVSDILVRSETKTALSVLSQFPDEFMTADDLCDFAEDPINPETALRVFDWGSRLGILHNSEQGYRLDSTYAAGLKTVFKE